jgi:hypothetical protein
LFYRVDKGWFYCYYISRVNRDKYSYYKEGYMYKRISIALVISFLTCLFLTPTLSSARIYLFDKKLEINGSIEQKANWKYNLKSWEKGTGPHNSRVTPAGTVINGTQSNGGRYPQNAPTLFKTHLHLEGLYHVFNEGGHLLDAFVLFEWFYDWGPSMTGSLSRGIRARDEDKYKTPHGLEMLRELYVNYINGPWTLRVGKQMVVWGETGLQRTADVVNPVDLRSHIVGVDDWEDFKQGLWMFRGFYQTSFVNDLTLEWIVVPFDVKEIDLPKEGTMYNSKSMNMVCIMRREVFVSGGLTGTGTGPSSIITAMTRLPLSGTGDREDTATGPKLQSEEVYMHRVLGASISMLENTISINPWVIHCPDIIMEGFLNTTGLTTLVPQPPGTFMIFLSSASLTYH